MLHDFLETHVGFSRRLFLRHVHSGAAALGLAGLSGSDAVAASNEVLTPERFGARGDGRTNDSDAFAALAREVNSRGGGVVQLRRTTYLLGRQRRGVGGRAFSPVSLLHFSGCSKPLMIQGNGAKLRCADGLAYGTFDPLTGEPNQHPMPFTDPTAVATPYDYMIKVESCTGPIHIVDLELDGNLERLRLGGQWGDTGWQIPAVGIFLLNNRGDEILRNVHSHHHAQDGLMISGLDDPALAARVRRQFDNLRCEHNGRQGCSIIGGRGYAFANCRFSHTGTGKILSAPAAGLDIEAEGKQNRDFTFVNCQFVNNAGCGMVADSGDSAGALFRNCSFVGTRNWSIWPNKPNFRFHNCRIVGSAVRCHGDTDPSRAVQFHDCLFTDDPKFSPTGEVYREGRKDGSLANLSDSQNVLFNRCTLVASYGSVLPWTQRVIFRDCTMRQGTETQGYPRGTYLGRNSIVGNVDLYGSKVDGRLMLNGKLITG